MKYCLTNKIKASSLIEVVVALVLIVIVFGSGMRIYLNVLKASIGQQQMDGYHYIENIYFETVKQKKFYDEDFKIGENQFYKKVSKYKNDNDLLQLHCEIIAPDLKKIVEADYLIINTGNENK